MTTTESAQWNLDYDQGYAHYSHTARTMTRGDIDQTRVKLRQEPGGYALGGVAAMMDELDRRTDRRQVNR